MNFEAQTTPTKPSVARLREDAHEIADAVETTATELQEYLRSEFERRPYLTLAVAVGAGYILGGGLPSRLTGLVFGFGSRMALAVLARQLSARFAADQSSAPSSHAYKGEFA